MTSIDIENKCPFCGSSLEPGYVVGDVADSLRAATYRSTLQWFNGDPGWSKSFLQLGEPVGETAVTKGSYALGKRCVNCRKIILDY